MMKVEFTLADGHLIANRNDDFGHWIVHIDDALTGDKVENLTWSDEEIAAVLALAFNGDDPKSAIDVDVLYGIAEPLFKNVPISCRLIP